MYIFRRAAARAVSVPRQLRPSPRFNSFQSSIPSISRSFHQSRLWLSEEQKKEPESPPQQDAVSESSGTTSDPIGKSEDQSQNAAESASASTSPTEPNVSTAQDALSESSGTTSAPIGQSEHQPQSVTEQASELAQKAQSTVSETASSVKDALTETAQTYAPSVRSNRGERDNARQNDNMSQSKILYVGNLFFEVTAPQLEAEFAKFGEITNSRVITDNRGLSKGFAYIEYANQAEADKAVEVLNQKVFQGRRMSVQYHKRRAASPNSRARSGPGKPSKTLFIGNMSYQMSDKDLNDLFRQIKGVLDVRVAIDRRSGQPRGFAHADFTDVESAERAKEALERKTVYGRTLRVDYSGQTGNTRGSPREEQQGDDF